MASSLVLSQTVSDSRDLIPDENVSLSAFSACGPSDISDGLFNLSSDRADVTVCASHIRRKRDHNNSRSCMFGGKFVDRLTDVPEVGARLWGGKCSDVSRPFLKAVAHNSENLTRLVSLAEIPGCVIQDIGDSRANTRIALRNKQACKAFDRHSVRNSLGSDFASEGGGALKLVAQSHDLKGGSSM